VERREERRSVEADWFWWIGFGMGSLGIEARVWKVLSMLHEALRDEVVVTKR